MKGNEFIKLRITGQNLNLEEITEKLSHKPSFTYRKGDSYIPKYADKKPIMYKEDCWLLEVEKDVTQTLDDTIIKFVSNFTDKTGYLQELSGEYDVTLWVSAYPDEEQSNIHLSPDTLKVIADMGISVDFNILFLKDFYEETYKD